MITVLTTRPLGSQLEEVAHSPFKQQGVIIGHPLLVVVPLAVHVVRVEQESSGTHYLFKQQAKLEGHPLFDVVLFLDKLHAVGMRLLQVS